MSSSNTKAMSWFRFYNEAIDDEKLRLLAFEDRWHFTALLCCKSKGLLDSATDSPELKSRKIALKLGLSTRELDEVARRLAEVGLVDRDTLQPLAWDKRQFQTDTSAERTRQYRERQKKASDKVKRHGDVTVTVQETETETETEVIPPLPPKGAAPVGAGRVEPVFPSLVEQEDFAADEPITPADNLAPSAGTACTTRGAVCLAMKAAGIPNTAPGRETLRVLVAAGADLTEFVSAAQKAVALGKADFGYALGIVSGERKRAAELATKLHTGPLPAAKIDNKQIALEQRNRAVAAEWVAQQRALLQGEVA